MESIDGLATIRLTKDNRQKILDINDGFTAESYYNSKRGGSYIREYKISNGKLVIRDMLRNTTNENQDDKSWIATDAEVHRFVLKYLWKTFDRRNIIIIWMITDFQKIHMSLMI